MVRAIIRARPKRSDSTAKNKPPAAPPSKKTAKPRFPCQSTADRSPAESSVNIGVLKIVKSWPS